MGKIEMTQPSPRRRATYSLFSCRSACPIGTAQKWIAASNCRMAPPILRVGQKVRISGMLGGSTRVAHRRGHRIRAGPLAGVALSGRARSTWHENDGSSKTVGRRHRTSRNKQLCVSSAIMNFPVLWDALSIGCLTRRAVARRSGEYLRRLAVWSNSGRNRHVPGAPSGEHPPTPAPVASPAHRTSAGQRRCRPDRKSTLFDTVFVGSGGIRAGWRVGVYASLVLVLVAAGAACDSAHWVGSVAHQSARSDAGPDFSTGVLAVSCGARRRGGAGDWLKDIPSGIMVCRGGALSAHISGKARCGDLPRYRFWFCLSPDLAAWFWVRAG